MRIAFNGLEMGDDSLYNVNSIEGLDSLPDLTIGIATATRLVAWGQAGAEAGNHHEL